MVERNCTVAQDKGGVGTKALTSRITNKISKSL